MPTYCYKCSCGETAEEVMSIKQHVTTIPCITCGAKMEQYHKAPPNVDTFFKGSYKDLNPCSGRFNF